MITPLKEGMMKSTIQVKREDGREVKEERYQLL
jgi:hypothetical protein